MLAVGGLQRRKGFEMIVDAFAALRRPDATLVSAAPAASATPWNAVPWRAARHRDVRFEGHVSRERVGDYFAAADVFVHAAELEAAGNVVLEALAAGAVAIVTDSGGPGEYVQDGVNGFVIPVGDTEALTARLEALLSNPALRDTLAAAARERVERRHAYPRMIGDVRGIYDAVRRPAVPSSLPFQPPTPDVATSSR